jgi:tRNA acetyltransferase TAN1
LYDFNLLVSYRWGSHVEASNEIKKILERLGDESPLIRRTFAQGIMGVKTSLNNHQISYKLKGLFEEDPWLLQFAVKWVPIDAWTISTIEDIKEVVNRLKDRIREGERWRMTVEKRRYTEHHKIDVIRPVAELIDERVDLENPDKILHIELIGRYAGISLLKPEEIFSVAKPYPKF